MTRLPKRLVPAPLRAPISGTMLFLIPPLRRRIRRTWRRRNRLKKWVTRMRNRLRLRVRRARTRLNRLRHKLQKALKNVWRRQLKQHIWRIHTRTLGHATGGESTPSTSTVSLSEIKAKIQKLKNRLRALGFTERALKDLQNLVAESSE